MDISLEEKKFPIIETDRLILRSLDLSDSNDLFLILSSENVTKYYGMYPMKEISESEQLISKFENSFKEDKAIRWGIELKESGKIIGTCGFHNWNKRHFRAEIGYELGEEFWNNGYAKEAVIEIINYGFENMNLNRIEAVVYPENFTSEKMLINLGFKHEGYLRNYAYFRDTLQDLNMFSIIKN